MMEGIVNLDLEKILAAGGLGAGTALILSNINPKNAVENIASGIKNVSNGVGTLYNAAFAQVKAKPTKTFSKKGKRIYSDLAGEDIETVEDLTNAIKSGKVNPSDIEVNYVLKDGLPVIDNTRTSTALVDAGVPQNKWNGVNQTGKEQYPGHTWDQAVQDKIDNNAGKPITPDVW